jgi:GNAT superfamily N-acetyltransferase
MLEERHPPEGLVIRTANDDDLEWVVRRHGEIYMMEKGWDERFRALVEAIVEDYRHDHDPARERLFIAEVEDERVGCVLLVGGEEGASKLRILLVDPDKRGRGIGTQLVSECLEFARRAGYEKVTLWTEGGLIEARRLYERAGFEWKKDEEPHLLFGDVFSGQYWELDL